MKGKSIKKREQEIKHGERIMFCMFGIPPLYNMFAYIIGSETLVEHMWIMHVFKYLCLLPAIFFFIRFERKKLIDIIKVSVPFLGLLVISPCIFTAYNKVVLSAVIYYVSVTLITMVMVSLLYDPDLMLVKFRKIAYIGCAELLIVCVFGNILHIYQGVTNYMVLGNGSMIYVSILLYWMLRERKWYDIIICFLTLGCYFVFTSRGSFGALLVVALYYLVFGHTQIKIKTKIIIISMVCVGLVLILFGFEAILYGMSELALANGWNIGKVLQSFLYLDSIFQSNGRLMMWGEAVKYIGEQLIGHGPMSSVWLFDGGYSHNFMLDVLLDFGVVIGSIFIFVIVYILIKMLLGKRYRRWSNVCAVLVLPGFVVLQLSGYWYTSYYIMILIYMFIVAKKETYCRKREMENVKYCNNI